MGVGEHQLLKFEGVRKFLFSVCLLCCIGEATEFTSRGPEIFRGAKIFYFFKMKIYGRGGLLKFFASGSGGHRKFYASRRGGGTSKFSPPQTKISAPPPDINSVNALYSKCMKWLYNGYTSWLCNHCGYLTTVVM